MSQPPVTRERRVMYTDFTLSDTDDDPGEARIRRVATHTRRSRPCRKAATVSPGEQEANGWTSPRSTSGRWTATAKVVDGVAARQMDLPTPCDGWSVRELLNHIVGGNFWAAELAAGKTIDEVGDRLDGDMLGDDPRPRTARRPQLAAAAFNAPGAMDAPCAVSYGPYPARSTADTASSTSRSTVGIWPRPPVRTRRSILRSSTRSPRSSHRRSTCSPGSGMFGTTIGVAADADPQTRLLSQLGRHD